MKFRNLLYAFFLSFIVIGLISCSDENDNGLRLSGESLNILPQGQATIDIYGGTAPYTIISDKEDVATATIENKVINISSKNQVKAVLTIKDKSNATVSLTVEVKTQIQSFEIEKYLYSVEATDETVKATIKSDLEKNLPVPVGGRYELEFLSSKKDSGNLKVYSSQLVNGFVSGTFQLNYSDDIFLLVTLNYNSEKFIYQWVQIAISSLKDSSPIPMNQVWIEDLTDTYKKLYPDAGITKVGRGQVFKVVQNK